jgi:hypothetical protein
LKTDEEQLVRQYLLPPFDMANVFDEECRQEKQCRVFVVTEKHEKLGERL